MIYARTMIEREKEKEREREMEWRRRRKLSTHTYLYTVQHNNSVLKLETHLGSRVIMAHCVGGGVILILKSRGLCV